MLGLEAFALPPGLEKFVARSKQVGIVAGMDIPRGEELNRSARGAASPPARVPEKAAEERGSGKWVPVSLSGRSIVRFEGLEAAVRARQVSKESRHAQSSGTRCSVG